MDGPFDYDTDMLPDLPSEAYDRMVEDVIRMQDEFASQKAAYAKYMVAMTDFLTRWPNYCRTCGATGEVSYTENASPMGSGENWPMTTVDLCSCLYDGLCPRCSNEVFALELDDYDDAVGECPICGWNSGKDTETAPVW